jgi:hypothetical protein
MKPLTLAGVLAASLATFGAPTADGSLPPQPYRYVHPPASLAAVNIPPQSGKTLEPVAQGQVVSGLLFTRDGQAGISFFQGSFGISRAATGINITVQPLAPLAGLPPQIGADGNAYEVQATQVPGHRTVALTKVVTLTLRWPHVPLGIYMYQNSRWRELCSSANSTITGSTISCPTKKLGIFEAVAMPLTLGIGGSAAGTSATPSSSSNTGRIVLIGAAIVIVLMAAILGFIAVRPARSGPKNTGS